MKMKQYCEKVIHDFIDRGLIKVYYRGKQPLFDLTGLQPSFYSYYECIGCKMYVGAGIMMFGIGGNDVLVFSKDGNNLGFNIKDILKGCKDVPNV